MSALQATDSQIDGKNMDFIEMHTKGMETLGFWTEEYKSVVIGLMEKQYKTEIIREWTIVDLVLNGDKALVKWKKRFQPLSDEELKDKYGRELLR